MRLLNHILMSGCRHETKNVYLAIALQHTSPHFCARYESLWGLITNENMEFLG